LSGVGTILEWMGHQTDEKDARTDKGRKKDC